MFNVLRALNVNKAAGSDVLTGKLIREFACELNIPVTDFLNSSPTDGILTLTWKISTILPVPPVQISELRPIYPTSLLAIVCEGYVTDKVLENISSSIDSNQSGSIKVSSTSHCLIKTIDVLIKVIHWVPLL